VRYRRRDLLRIVCHYEVDDTASCIDPAVLSKIFDPFFSTKFLDADSVSLLGQTIRIRSNPRKSYESTETHFHLSEAGRKLGRKQAALAGYRLADKLKEIFG